MEFVVFDWGLRVKFSRHAVKKFAFLKRYGFVVGKALVVEVVLYPDGLDERGGQFFAVKVLDDEYALKVVY